MGILFTATEAVHRPLAPTMPFALLFKMKRAGEDYTENLGGVGATAWANRAAARINYTASANRAGTVVQGSLATTGNPQSAADEVESADGWVTFCLNFVSGSSRKLYVVTGGGTDVVTDTENIGSLGLNRLAWGDYYYNGGWVGSRFDGALAEAACVDEEVSQAKAEEFHGAGVLATDLGLDVISYLRGFVNDSGFLLDEIDGYSWNTDGGAPAYTADHPSGYSTPTLATSPTAEFWIDPRITPQLITREAGGVFYLPRPEYLLTEGGTAPGTDPPPEPPPAEPPEEELDDPITPYDLLIDLDGDGYFDTDILTGKVRTTTGRGLLFRTVRGNDVTARLHPPRAGVAEFVLDNDDGTFDPPTGGLRPGRATALRAIESTIVYPLHRGSLQRPAFLPGVFPRKNAHLESTGPLSTLVGRKVSTALYQGITTGEAIDAILAALSVPSYRRSIDTGECELEWWWVDEQDALQAVLQLVQTEGAGAQLYETGDGVIVFKGRHAIYEEASGNTVQETFRSAAGATEPLFSAPAPYDEGLLNVINAVEREVITRAQADDVGVVWTVPGDQFTLAPNEVRSFRIRSTAGDPITGAIAPVAGLDYTVLAGSLEDLELDRTSGGNVVLTLTASSAGVTIADLQVRAYLVSIVGQYTVAAGIDASASQAEYGVHAYPGAPLPHVSRVEALAWADVATIAWRNGIPYMAITVAGGANATRKVAALEREINERVRVIDVERNIDGEFHVDAIQHELESAAYLRSTLYLRGAEAAGLEPFLVGDNLDGPEVLWA